MAALLALLRLNLAILRQKIAKNPNLQASGVRFGAIGEETAKIYFCNETTNNLLFRKRAKNY